MPRRAKRPCSIPGCPRLTDGSYCLEHGRQVREHGRQERAQYDSQRGSAAKRGYGAPWKKLRAMYLMSHPLCVDPDNVHGSVVVTATEVDHIKPKVQGGMDEWENLQALCKSCHSRKTAVEDGGYGRRK